jgi:hypothetical protein
MDRPATTLFQDIQSLFERTYTSVGINLEECIIDRQRCRQLTKLAGAQAAELSDLGRTFLRSSGGNLRIGIYFSSWLIRQLEKHDPRGGLGEENIRELITFVEEINHALHGALWFHRGQGPVRDENYARNLELQAGVDTYLVLLLFMAFFRRPGRLTDFDRRWLRFHCFEEDAGRGLRRQSLRSRYAETSRLAARYTGYLESLSQQSRLAEIQRFHALDYPEKVRHILLLPAPSAESAD